MDFAANLKDGDQGGFKPIAYQNHNLVVHNNLGILFRRVDYWGQIPPFQCIDLGALAAATMGALQQIPMLEMANNEIGQWRWYVIDNAQIHLFLPGGIQIGQLKNLMVPFDMQTPMRDPNLESTEIFVWQDNRPAVRAYNGMSYALAGVRIIAGGYRFHTFDLENPPTNVEIYNSKGTLMRGPDLVKSIKMGIEPATHIWTSGRGTGD